MIHETALPYSIQQPLRLVAFAVQTFHRKRAFSKSCWHSAGLGARDERFKDAIATQAVPLP